MKHLQTYRLFESTQVLTEIQKEFLDQNTRGSWSLNPTSGDADVDGDFDCSRGNLKDFKGVRFGRVSGNFYCGNNSLTSLEGAPESVGGDFSCHSNSFTSLEGAPESVGGSFYCDAFSTSDWNLEGKLKILETGSEADKNLMATLVSPEALQKLIDQNPSKAAVSLKGVWKTLKSNPKYSNLEFPEGHSKEADLLADLTDVGL